MSDFEREERYIVIKKRHLAPDEELLIQQLLIVIGAPDIECVVVESDWPNYEETWDRIRQIEEARHEQSRHHNRV